nr:MAG: ORF1 [Torque teno virus]
MWWSWWRRRAWRPRRRWRRWRRRRPARRRRPGAPRYTRRRRVRRLRRRRRWRRRGWARRAYLRHRRRLKKRKKIVITQWNPSVVKKCVIRGHMPLLICGTGTTGTTYKNYGSHLHDYKKYDPFGGGISTLNFTLSYLYDEYVKHRNTWSRSNQDLELVRYKGCSFKLYRHETCDFFVTYNRKHPFTDSQLTGPMLHPANMMLRKKKIIVKSYKTRPKGKGTTTFRVRPPTLFTDKWYFQKDFCKIPLVNIGASIGNLRFPFCRPQTDNPCIHFQVLSPAYNGILSIQADYLRQNYEALINYLKRHWHIENKKGTLSNFQHADRIGTVFNTFKTEEHIKDPPIVPAKNETQSADTDTTANKYYTGGAYNYNTVSSLWGDYIYKMSIIDAFKSNAEKYYAARKGTGPPYTSSQELNHKTGIYSPIFLSKQRLSPDFPGFYQEVVYNPANDKGIGNKVWVDACTKNDSTWNPTARLNYAIQDLPLWMCMLGYSDYITKAVGSPGYWKEVRLTIICPYTDPPLTDKTNTDLGFIPFDYNFGDGKMPDGQSYIPILYRFNWYICMFHQQNLMNDLAQCGPFAYDGSEKSAVLSCRYKFTFLFGGNPITQQTLKDPCQQPKYPFPDTGGQPPRIQVENPKHLHEGYYFRAWDLRRGLFGERAVKRMQTQPITAEFIAGPPKRSKLEVPAIAASDSYSKEPNWDPWSDSEETQSKSSQENEAEKKTPQVVVQQQLRLQIQEQKLLKHKLKKLFKQLVKTQHHLNAPIFH